MARTQTFERDDVIREARTLFWKSGYAETAIPDLEAATGLSRSSLYNTFGSKRGLFDAAIESYMDEIVRPLLLPLKCETVHPEALFDYLNGLQQAFSTPGSPARNGCLLINTARSTLAEEPQIAATILNYRTELLQAFSHGISAFHPHFTKSRRELLSAAVTDLVIASFSIARVHPQESARVISNAATLFRSQTP